MRLALVSDVHADHWKGTAALSWKRAPLADVLLVAGDLHDDQDGSAEELRKAALVRRACACCAPGCTEHGAALCGNDSDLEHRATARLR
jgi:predicted phosphodiesterase